MEPYLFQAMTDLIELDGVEDDQISNEPKKRDNSLECSLDMNNMIVPPLSNF